MLYEIQGWDVGQGNLVDTMFDNLSDRACIGTTVEEGEYFADGFVDADFSRIALSTGFRAWLAYLNIPAAAEIIMGVDLRPMDNPLGGPNVIWGGDFLEAGTLVGAAVPPNVAVTRANLDRKVIAMLDDTDGSIKFFQGRTDTNFDWIWWGGGTTFLATTLPNVVVPGEAWATYAFRFNLTTDTIEVKKNGVTILLAAGVGMGGGVFNRVGLSRNQLSVIAGTQMDHFYVLSTAGGVRTAEFPTPRVCTYMPNVDSGPNAWVPTPVTPNHFENVDDLDRVIPYQQNVYDQDVTRLDSAVLGDREMYQFVPTLPALEIKGVQFQGFFKATGGANATVNLVATSPLGVDHVFGPYTIITGYTHPADAVADYQGIRSPVMEQDPETGLDWTDARLAVWEFGFENVTGAAVRCTSFSMSKIAAPAPPAPPVVVMPGIGTGGGGAGAHFKESCSAPPTLADLCLMGRGEIMRAVNQQAVCDLDPPPWREMPEGAERFQQVGSIILPAVENVDNLVLRWTVPEGYDGIITTLSNFFNGAGFINGSGDLIWRLMFDNQWFKDTDAVDVAVGRPSAPLKLKGAGYRIYSHQTMRFFVSLGTGALGRLDPAGRIVCALFGWIYPRQHSRLGGNR